MSFLKLSVSHHFWPLKPLHSDPVVLSWNPRSSILLWNLRSTLQPILGPRLEKTKNPISFLLPRYCQMWLYHLFHPNKISSHEEVDYLNKFLLSKMFHLISRTVFHRIRSHSKACHRMELWNSLVDLYQFFTASEHMKLEFEIKLFPNVFCPLVLYFSYIQEKVVQRLQLFPVWCDQKWLQIIYHQW